MRVFSPSPRSPPKPPYLIALLAQPLPVVVLPLLHQQAEAHQETHDHAPDVREVVEERHEPQDDVHRCCIRPRVGLFSISFRSGANVSRKKKQEGGVGIGVSIEIRKKEREGQ